MANDRQDALKDYVEVNVRIERFYQKFPNGRINTFMQSNDNGVVIMRAEVFRDLNDAQPSATGHAYEKEGSSYINKTSYIENCETSAVGRALAILGFEIKKSVASKEEVANAQLQQQTPNVNQTETQKPNENLFPSEAQVKMIQAKLTTAGYGKGDLNMILKLISGVVGYEVKTITDIKKTDVSRLAEFLTTHKKGDN